MWRAVDEAAGHEVAVKALGARAAWSMTGRARLRIAFGMVSAVSDPGVARVHEYGEMALPGGLAIPTWSGSWSPDRAWKSGWATGLRRWMRH